MFFTKSFIVFSLILLVLIFLLWLIKNNALPYMKTLYLKYYRTVKDIFHITVTDLIKVGEGTSLTSAYKNIFITTRLGKVYRYCSESRELTEIYDIAKTDPTFTTKDMEEGLLGITYDKKHNTFYMSYTVASDTVEYKTYLVINEYTYENNMSEDLLSPPYGASQLVFSEEIFRLGFAETYHHAGTLQFGSDGYLYISTGDGGPQGDPMDEAQNVDSWRGKILRMDVTDPSSIETIAIGLRNPWKFSVTDNLDVFIGDVGWDTVESVYTFNVTDYTEKGIQHNFGWAYWEGTYKLKDGLPYENITPPIFEYPNEKGVGAAVIGGYEFNTYRPRKLSDDGVKPDIKVQNYIFADFNGIIRIITKNENDIWEQTGIINIDEPIFSLGMTFNSYNKSTCIYVLTKTSVKKVNYYSN